MICLKLAAFVCLLTAIECVDKTTYKAACDPTADTCSFANTACHDKNNDHETLCACSSTYVENGSNNGCDAATTIDSTCTTATCIDGAACTDVDGTGSGDMKCLCSAGYHLQGSVCVKNPGTLCSQYGQSCTNNAKCVAVSGRSTLPSVCQCNAKYYSDGVYCVAGGNFVTASTLIILAAFVASKLFY